MQTPDSVIEIKLQPMIQGLSRAINALDKSVDAQSALMHQNSEQAQLIASTLSKLADDFRRAEARSIQTVGGPWGRSSETPDGRESRALTSIDPKATP